MSPKRWGQTIHDETEEAIRDGISAAKRACRPYLVKVKCSTPNCGFLADFDLAGIEGTAMVQKYISKPRMRPDIALTSGEQVTAIIEVVDTNPPSIEKRKKLVRFGKPTFMVKAEPQTSYQDGFNADESLNAVAYCYVCEYLRTVGEPQELVKNLNTSAEFEHERVASEEPTTGSGEFAVEPTPAVFERPMPFFTSASSTQAVNNRLNSESFLDRLHAVLILTNPEYRNAIDVWLTLTNPEYRRRRLALELLLQWC